MRSAVAALVLPVLLLTGCALNFPTVEPEATPTASPVEQATPRSTPVYTFSEAPTPTPSVPLGATAPPIEDPAAPDGARPEVFLATLAEVDPYLAENEDRAFRRGARLCERLANGESPEALTRYTEQEFEGGVVTDITSGQAERIWTAARDYYC